MLNEMSIRKLEMRDEEFIWQMLMYASHEQSVDEVKRQPELARYVKDWGRVGDTGFVAINQDRLLGAAWIRLWSDSDKGFGYVDNRIPELVVSTLPTCRNFGVGTLLVNTLINDIRLSYPAVSLSVRESNPAVNLYKKLGFVKVEGSEVINRTGGISFVMQKNLELKQD
jgi:ribosomal protein S18 acetylase RimI-like enzyme